MMENYLSVGPCTIISSDDAFENKGHSTCVPSLVLF